MEVDNNRNYLKMKKYKEAHPICERCKTKSSTECHHIKPIVLGGQDDECNYIALCDDCHDFIHKNGYTRSELTKIGQIKSLQSPIKEVLIDKIALLEKINEEEPCSVADILDIILEAPVRKTV